MSTKSYRTPKQPDFRFTTPLQIRFTDIDQLGHVTNSVYQQYYDLGRMTYFTHIFSEQMDWMVEGLVLVNVNIDFFSSIRQFDQIEVRTCTYEIGVKSLRMLQEIYNHTTGQICSRCTSVMVACRKACTESIAIPERWVNSIKQFEPALQVGTSIPEN